MGELAMSDRAFRGEFAFWLRIMNEHALFLETGFTFYQVPLVSEAACFYHAYRDLRAGLAGGEPLGSLIPPATEITEQFLAFKLRVLGLALRCRSGGSGANLPLLVDHIAREAEVFLRLLRTGEAQSETATAEEFTSRIEFWLKIMVDHLRFVCHLLDPSQVTLLAQAAGLIARADPLLLQVRDYHSMLRAACEGFPALVRGIDEVTVLTKEIRDFKAAGTVLLQNCQALAIAPALLLDHTRREAEFFLAVLAAARQALAPLLNVTPQTLDAEELHRAIWAAAGSMPPMC